jgi:hypothetical protein
MTDITVWVKAQMGAMGLSGLQRCHTCHDRFRSVPTHVLLYKHQGWINMNTTTMDILQQGKRHKS